MIMFNYILFIGLIVLNINKGISSELKYEDHQYIERKMSDCIDIDKAIDFVEKVSEKAGIEKAVYAANYLTDHVQTGEDLSPYIRRLREINSKKFEPIIEEMTKEAFHSSHARYFLKKAVNKD